MTLPDPDGLAGEHDELAHRARRDQVQPGITAKEAAKEIFTGHVPDLPTVDGAYPLDSIGNPLPDSAEEDR